jgi:hypothetical protein
MCVTLREGSASFLRVDQVEGWVTAHERQLVNVHEPQATI